MPPPKLIVLPDYRDESGVPAFGSRKWRGQDKRYEWVQVTITRDELRLQAQQPVRIAHDPEYWLFHGRVVRQEGVASEPDVLVDLLQSTLEGTEDVGLAYTCQECGHIAHKWMGRCPECGAWNSFAEEVLLAGVTNQGSAESPARTDRDVAKAIELELARREEPIRWHRNELEEFVRQARLGLFPMRHSELKRVRSDELVLHVKHAVLKAERALERLSREVAAFEAFEQGARASRVSIPEQVKMFVWQRDRGQCVQCGRNERLEFDHIIPVAKGGSNTERNVQLLCELCNRAKGSSI